VIGPTIAWTRHKTSATQDFSVIDPSGTRAVDDRVQPCGSDSPTLGAAKCRGFAFEISAFMKR